MVYELAAVKVKKKISKQQNFFSYDVTHHKKKNSAA